MALISFFKKYKVVLLHIGAWMIYMGISALNRFLVNGEPINPLDRLLTQLPGIFVFYASSFVFFKFISPKKYLQFFFAEIGLYIVLLLLYHLSGDILAPWLIPHVTVPHFRLYPFLVGALYTFLVYTFFAFGYYFARRSLLNEKELNHMAIDKLAAEQGKLAAEYAFLRAQINPHFLHNTLNFFYAKSLGCSKELSDGILTLCDIMRYSLEGGEDSSGTVLLGREVEHLQNVIRINQLRFSHRLNVHFDIRGDVEAVRILPLVLITLAENAFKHGELTKKEHPLVFELEVGEDKSYIYFSTRNKKKTGPKELSHGIGINNIIQRLSSTYKEHYSLEIKDEEEFYSIALRIDCKSYSYRHLN
ncbi:MAG TPA: histidine kinase [Chitinophaga sp.]|uniref:sensor histidine kinase n=1 Tax=Chitinophaga sp. TaxID=1869181 RepID=UPI002D0AF7EC|nr:histidine kinase [Chitinophaga sp.]HVI45995.1 histidine kinase [Chitinophaga sp.]